MQLEPGQQSEPVSLSYQMELQLSDVVSKDEYNKVKEDYEKRERERESTIICC